MCIRTLALSSLVLASSACGAGNATSDAGPIEDDAGEHFDASADAGSGSPTVTVRIVATGDAFPHADGLAGQTARMTEAGVRSLALYRTMDDPNPLVLFRADGPDVAVGYVPGDETTLTSFDASALEAGVFTFGRLVQSYSRYEVDATLHRLDGSQVGVAESFQVIADRTVVDDVSYDAGHYEIAFRSPDHTEDWSGEDALFPDYSATPGAVGVVEAGEWAVYFPIDLEITHAPRGEAALTLEVNMYEAFRWADLFAIGYAADVFDVTDLSVEPVVRFGGNSFELTLVGL